MRTLLTGATGFVGSHVLDRLAQEGASVRILIRAATVTKENADQYYDPKSAY